MLDDKSKLRRFDKNKLHPILLDARPSNFVLSTEYINPETVHTTIVVKRL